MFAATIALTHNSLLPILFSYKAHFFQKSVKMKPLQKQSLLAYLQGHKEANERIAAERKMQLAQLTENESLSVYDNLCNMWQETSRNEGIDKLDARMIAFLIARRKRMNKHCLPKQ
jgi:hypothetical protein